MNPKVDFYFSKGHKWQEETRKLRMIVLSCGLTEELKWGCPCYTYLAVSSPSVTDKPGKQASDKSNIVVIHVFKEYCALLFFKGALLKDTNGMLIQQTKNVQAARQLRFTSSKDIVELEPIIKAYVFEAIEIEKAGLKVELKKTTEFNMPEEFREKLSARSGQALKAAFDALTPGRQRAYMLYFSAPKQSVTRQSRIEKYMPQILNGKGLDD